MLKTPVSILQELMVLKKLSIPDYQTQGTGQAHCMSFTCQVKTGNQTATGVGATKKDAKQDAARNMLKSFGVGVDNKHEISHLCLLPSKTSKLEGPAINYVGKLNEFSSIHRHPQPSYTDQVTVQNAQFCIICSFNEFKTEGYGYNKKDAKQDSAKKMLALVEENDLGYNPVEANSDKLEEDDELAQQVLNKYTEIMKNIKINDNNNDTNIETINNEEVNISTWDDLIELFRQRGYTYELETFQRYPLILSLKINERVLMNSGKSREEILKKFVISFINMTRDGINFSKPLIEDV